MKGRVILLKLIVSLLLILLLFLKTDVTLLKETILKVDFFFLASAILLFILSQVLSAYRWSKLLFPEKFSLSYWRLLTLYFIGMFFNNFMPTMIGGDLMRCYYLFKESGKGGASVASVFFDRYIGLTALVGLLFFSTLLGYPLIKDSPVIWLSLSFVGGYLFISICIWNKGFHSMLVTILERLSLSSLKNKFESFTDAVMEYRANLKLVFIVFMLSLIIQVIGITIFYQLSRGLSLGLPLLYFFIFVPLAMVVAMVPFSIAGIGVREGAFVFLFSTIGVPSANALGLSLLWFFMVLFVSMWGGIEYIRLGRSRRDIDELSV